MSDVVIDTSIEVCGDDVGSIDVPVRAWSSIDFYRVDGLCLEYDVRVDAIEIGDGYASHWEPVYYWLGVVAGRELYASIDQLSYEAA